MLQLLHVDDNPFDLELTSLYLQKVSEDLKIEWAASAGEAVERIGSQEFHCILCDYQMPETDGLELLRSLRRSGNDIPFILLTCQSYEGLAGKALDLGADDFFMKESSLAHYRRLLDSIVRTVATRRLQSECDEAWVALLENIRQTRKLRRALDSRKRGIARSA